MDHTVIERREGEKKYTKVGYKRLKVCPTKHIGTHFPDKESR
jgi:hypothetical protein